MEKRSAGHIIQMRMNDKEKEHRGRSRSGFQVFISRFFGEFKMLLMEEKWEKINESRIHGNVAIMQED